MTRTVSFLAGVGFVAVCAFAVADGPPTLAEICQPGYATAHRMSESQARAIKHELLKQLPGHRAAEYELDHIKPLCLGGSNDRSNLQMQPIDEARQKDELEWKACRMACKGKVDLEQAQSWFKRTHTP